MFFQSNASFTAVTGIEIAASRVGTLLLLDGFLTTAVLSATLKTAGQPLQDAELQAKHCDGRYSVTSEITCLLYEFGQNTFIKKHDNPTKTTIKISNNSPLPHQIKKVMIAPEYSVGKAKNFCFAVFLHKMKHSG